MLKYGFSFYPEHCLCEEELYKDIQIIKKSGATVVRMGEFCWDQLEYKDGSYNFNLLENAVELLGREGISSIICTPTSCPPSWLYHKHPEIAYVDYRGKTRPFGSRHSYCYNSDIYHKYSARIVEKIGTVFGNNPYVIGFQIGNEFAQEGSGRCHCPSCAEKFQQYLQQKYGSIENFNHSCGTYFWGLSYHDFSCVTPPTATTEPNTAPAFPGYFDNPGLRLNYERFASESIVAYSNMQIAVLRKYTDKPITSNSTSFGTNLVDYYDLYKETDLYALDIYPELYYGEKDYAELSYSFARNLNVQNFWILEFAVGGGHGLWAGEGRLQPYPGAIPLHVMHAFVNGAELLTHFQYKTFRSGAEQLNYALLDADRVPRRRYQEFQQTAHLLKSYEPIILSSNYEKADIAIVFDYDVLWSLRIKPIHHDYDYITYIQEIHQALRNKGYNVDIISKKDISDNYKMILLPSFIVSDDHTIDQLHQYVKNGGCLFATFLTSVKNMHNVAYDTGLPGHLKDLFGIEVYEVEPVFDASKANIEITFPEAELPTLTSQNKYWIDEITVHNAIPVAVFGDTYRKGHCIISKNAFGTGTAYYCGTALETSAFAQLLDSIAKLQHISKIPFDIPEHVSIIKRSGDHQNYYFLFNFSKQACPVYLDTNYQNALTNQFVGNEIVLDPFGFCCLIKSPFV